MPRVRCLTIRQPWIELILRGDKVIENRVWPTDYRGWIGLHAGVSKADVISRIYEGEDAAELNDGVHPDEMTFGALLGFAEVVDCRRYRDLPAKLKRTKDVSRSRDNWCWVLRNPQRLRKPMKMLGQLKFFTRSIPGRLIPKSVAAALPHGGA